MQFPEVPFQDGTDHTRVHHIGVVVDSIERYAQLWSAHFGMHATAPAVHDPIQRVNVQFFAGSHDQISVELVEPSSGDSPVLNALKMGGGLNHICFEVTNLDKYIAAARSNGGIVVVRPVPAKAFDNRLIAFVFYRGVGLVELLQAV